MLAYEVVIDTWRNYCWHFRSPASNFSFSDLAFCAVRHVFEKGPRHDSLRKPCWLLLGLEIIARVHKFPHRPEYAGGWWTHRVPRSDCQFSGAKYERSTWYDINCRINCRLGRHKVPRFYHRHWNTTSKKRSFAMPHPKSSIFPARPSSQLAPTQTNRHWMSTCQWIQRSVETSCSANMQQSNVRDTVPQIARDC